MRRLHGMRAAVFDFDKTVAETFRKSPCGLGVEEAYDLAVQEVLGNDAAKSYRQCGLKNRAPAELARDLLGSGARDEMLSHAQRYLRLNADELSGLVPEGKGLALRWCEEEPASIVGELLARVKLKALAGEVNNRSGTLWPEPCDGVLQFMDELRDSRIPIAILSSGHELFIRQTFAMWGHRVPFMVTDDDLRGLTWILPHMRIKPHQFLFQFLLRKWAEVEESAMNFHLRTGVYYFGDDLAKDGGLARNAGLRFGWYDRDQTDSMRLSKNQFRFSHWSELTTSLQIA